jgi:uncharacterized phiE125 gp8 family phage protein
LSALKANLSIAASDTTHDERLADCLRQARDQWEKDTDRCLCYQTWRVKCRTFFDDFLLPKLPINSITSVTYYDSNNAQQTLSTSLYSLDVDSVRLAYNVNLPSTVDRWDAWTITYRCGFSQDGALVPALDKRAVLLLAAFNFENPDMLLVDSMQSQRAYEALVSRAARASYP